MNYLSIAIKPEEPDDEVCPALVTMVGEKNNWNPGPHDVYTSVFRE